LSELRVIKKYPNRRLYDVRLSRYVTLQDIYRLLADQIEIKVLEQRSGRDITRLVLLQVLIDQEATASALLSDAFLTHLIRSYSAAEARAMAQHLERAIDMHLSAAAPPGVERVAQPRASVERPAFAP
jgi:polyhydroxyalkanoate synthesis repressor PhaR